ncbi:putative ribonuclease H-like domain-containing protein [Tanacetum coccineum]
MELENSQNNALAKLPMLKLREYEMWEIRIKQYFQIQDYALWEVIENGNSWVPIPVTALEYGLSTALKVTVPSTTEEKICKKNDCKRFGGNEATKRTQKALLKQQYENFNASSSESLDSIFNRLQKLVSRLAILGVVTPPEDLNVKFLRSLPSEWDTHVVVWMNKPDFDTMGLDDLYNNFKIVEQKVKRSTGAINDEKNLAFLNIYRWQSSINNINMLILDVSTGTTKVNTASTETSTASFSDATVYAFLSTQPQGSQLVHEDLEQLHDDDLEEMDLKCDMAEEKIQANCSHWLHDSGYQMINLFKNFEAIRKQYDDILVKLDDTGFKVLIQRGLEEFKQPDVNEYGPGIQSNSQLNDKGFVDSGCSRHMSGNIAHLSDFKDFDGGYVTFGGGANGGRITGKGTIKTDKLDFDDVYFVKELKFNLFSVSQMCDKKNYVLFTDSECLVLSLNFKLPDENQILLKIPRQDNMYILDLKNIDPKVGLLSSCKGGYILRNLCSGHRRLKGIKREYSVARTPQQNGVAERKNRTLIEAARTMLADSKLPTTFWAEAVSTACYVQNRVLIVKPYNKTPYELFRGFFVGYSLSSKAFRTRKVQENLHIGFLENKPMIEGNGPKWLFDLDSLTQSMNYVPVVAGTFSNDFAGKQGVSESSTSSQQDQDWIAMPIWKDASYFGDASPNIVDDAQIEDTDELHDEDDTTEESNDGSNLQNDGTADQQLNTARQEVNTGSREVSTALPEVNTATPEDS